MPGTFLMGPVLIPKSGAFDLRSERGSRGVILFSIGIGPSGSPPR